MSADFDSRSDPWLETVAADASARGIVRPKETLGLRERAPLSATVPSGIEILDILASGGMGTVELARQLALDREVAVKSIRPTGDEEADGEAAAELLREAWVMGALEHPNIVPVHDIVVGAGWPEVVMKRIDGDSWARLLAAPDRPPLTDLARLRTDIETLGQVINAIRLAHDRGIVHRDIKPANVMIGRFGEVYVVDWGLAVSLGDEADGRFARATEATTGVAGTPAYMAPEMLGGQSAVIDERTDIYLLGATLLEVLTGRPPHPGGSVLEALEHVRRGKPEIPDDLPAGLTAICRKALATDPDERYASADELLFELRQVLDRLSSVALAVEAKRPLVELEALLATPDPERGRVHHLFGECRFGFRSALAAWPENPEARRGLGVAIALVAEDELGRDDGATALALLAEHPDPPAELLERARRAADARRDRDARLARLEADADPRTGQWSRVLVTVGGSLLWTVFPIVLALADFEARLSRAGFIGGAVVATGAWSTSLLLLWLRLRHTFRLTSVNRVVFWGCFAGAVGTVALAASFIWIETPVVYLPSLAMLSWAITAAVLAVAVDLRFLVLALVFFIAFAVSAIEPAWRYWIMAVANLGIAVMALMTWGRDELRLNRS